MLRDYEPGPEEPDGERWPYNKPSLPHSGGLLFQQWLCDVFSRAEAQRLTWVRMHQAELRADTYQGLRDAINDPSYVAGQTKIGKQIILPAFFPGGRRR